MTNVKVNDRTDNLSPAAINYTSGSQISRKKGKIGCQRTNVKLQPFSLFMTHLSRSWRRSAYHLHI